MEELQPAIGCFFVVNEISKGIVFFFKGLELQLLAHLNGSRGKQIKRHMVFRKFTSSGHRWRKGVVFDFSLTQEENVGGWWARARGRAKGGDTRHGDSSILCLAPRLSHGIWFVYKPESVTGSCLGSWLRTEPGRRQPGWTRRRRRPPRCSKPPHGLAWPTGWDFMS